VLNLVPRKREDSDCFVPNLVQYGLLRFYGHSLYSKLAGRKPYFSQRPLNKIRCSDVVKYTDRESREVDSPRPANWSGICHINSVLCVMTHCRVSPVPITLQNLKSQIRKRLHMLDSLCCRILELESDTVLMHVSDVLIKHYVLCIEIFMTARSFFIHEKIVVFI
jgi:hypothetical protein